MSKPAAVIVGASRDRGKYGNLSVRAHRTAGYDVFPVNPQAAEIEGLPAYRSLADLPARSYDRVSLYVPPEVGVELLAAIAALRPRELWLNPGAGSPALVKCAEALGLHVVEGCSIVDANLRPVHSTATDPTAE